MTHGTHVTLQPTVGMFPGLSDALTKLIDAENGGISAARTRPPVQYRRWESPDINRSLQWSDENFGSLEVRVNKFALGIASNEGNNTQAQINYAKTFYPWLIAFDLVPVAGPGVRVIHVADGLFKDVTVDAVPQFKVDVSWDKREQPHVPFTRRKGKDNVDVIFLREDGMFITLQISVTTRNGEFWVGVQEIYSGQVVRTTRAKAEALPITSVPVGSFNMIVVPMYAENAYPGSDFAKTFPKAATFLVNYALEHGAVSALSKCVVSQWEPKWPTELPAQLKKNGWQVGVVLYFNMVTGYGFVRCEDGKSCFVHFKNIVDESLKPVNSTGKLPMLHAMHGVALKWSEQDGKRSANAVLALN